MQGMCQNLLQQSPPRIVSQFAPFCRMDKDILPKSCPIDKDKFDTVLDLIKMPDFVRFSAFSTWLTLDLVRFIKQHENPSPISAPPLTIESPKAIAGFLYPA